MNKIVISVESTCDLSAEVIKEYDMALINMEYMVNNQTHIMGDGAYTMKQFYDKMREGASVKTTQVNEYSATEHLESILEQGNDVIHLAFSSSLSGTYNSFAQAAKTLKEKYPNRKIAVIDSLCACAGQGIYAVIVAEYVKTHSFEQTVGYAESLKQRILHYFVVDDLKYLAKGGRISKSTALLGNTLHMKPVMHMNREGKLVAYKKVISRKKSLMTVADMSISAYRNEFDRIFIAHADCKDDAKFVADRIFASLGITPELFDLGMVIGSHSGPGTLAVFFTGEGRE